MTALDPSDEAKQPETDPTPAARQHTVNIGDAAVVGIAVAGDVHGSVTVQYPDLPRLPPVDQVAAEAAFAQLPFDAVPDVARTLPAGSRMPYAANALFQGRDDELRAVAAALAAGDANVISTGIGGVGKTSLAIEAAWRYGPHFLGGVFWVNCAEAVNIPSEIAQCGGPGGLRLAGMAGLSLDDQVRLVRAEWAREIPRLLIFDNCEDPELLHEYRPQGGGCRVLVTSRNALWPPTVRAARVALDVLTLDASVVLLQALCARLTRDEAAQVAEALGRLPLALHLAGSFLNRYGTPVPKYLETLDSPTLLEHPSLTGRGVKEKPSGREMHVAKAFALSLDQLAGDDPIDTAARALLARAACLAPGEPFPQELLEATLAVSEGDDEAALNRSDGVARLLEVGLLERAGKESLKLHRLLARYAGRAVVDDATLGDVEDIINNSAGHLNRASYPLQWGQIQVHLRHLTDRAMGRDDERAARLCNNMGYLLKARGNLAAAHPYYERALIIREQILGSTHPDTTRSLNNLGTLLQAQGDFESARRLLERTLAIRLQTLGSSHPDTATSLNNLGILLNEQGAAREARPYYERALAIRVQTLGPTHPDTAQSLNNIGMLLQAQGAPGEAQKYLEYALAIREDTLGLTHPDTALSLNNLGFLMQGLGKYAAAQRYYEQALTIYEQVLGPKHPTTASILGNLATVLQGQGKYVAARAYLERALVISEDILGLNHPGTAQSLNNLGYLLEELGDFVGARSYYERALTIREQTLGATHPDTATSLNNVGTVLDSMGAYPEARSYYERALTIREHILGLHHADTAQSLNNLGYLLHNQGEYTAAWSYYERALSIYENVFGLSHFETANILNNIGALLREQGDFTGARPYYERVLAIREPVLGPNHPDVAHILNNIAILHHDQGNFEDAVRILRRVLAIFETAFGPKHPYTSSSRTSLSVIEKKLRSEDRE